VSIDVPDVINSSFEADARRDTDAIVALFTDEAVVASGSYPTRESPFAPATRSAA
jgi:hypothetical protein